MKTLRIFQHIGLTILSVVGVITVLATAFCLASGIRPVIVASGSMAPSIPTGAVVFHKTAPASDLKVGDVVTVPRPGLEGVVTHRITSIEPAENGQYTMTMKGDANKSPDPQPYVVDKADKMSFSVPHLGTVLSWMRTHPIQTAVALLALLVFSLWPAARFTVHLPDGRVLRNLSRREAEAHCAAITNTNPQPSAS
ncbi:MAG: signal peptidase I [Bifidobacteriaceae bacterium]|jgi:signal peptidase|nr:signal peptidase I [Bifidobacteriaceae bacterium]